MRVVADTNTLVSGFGWGGAPGLVVDAILAGRLALITSQALRDELARYCTTQSWPRSFPTRTGSSLHSRRSPTLRLAVVADEPDNRVLGAAVAGQAEAVVTGDAALLELRLFEDIPILTARELADLIASQP